MVDGDKLVAQLLEVALKRGIKALYIDDDGYAKAFTPEFFKKYVSGEINGELQNVVAKLQDLQIDVQNVDMHMQNDFTQLLNDFDSKIPQPFTFDPDGRLQVLATLVGLQDIITRLEHIRKDMFGLHTVMYDNVFIANHMENGIANNDYIYFYIHPAPKIPIYLYKVRVFSEGDLIFSVYQKPDITDAGEKVSVFPADDRKSITPNAVIRKYPSWNDMGTQIEQIYVAGNGQYAFPVDLFENRILSNDYLISVKNVSGNNLQHIALEMIFAELLE